jgi:hypothetical protein
MEETVGEGSANRPPAPSDTPRRVRLYPHQWLGLPLLMLVPGLALLGVLGPSEAGATLEGRQLQVRVDHPTRLRAGQRAELRVEIRNAVGPPLRDIAVIFDAAYLEAFAEVRFQPGLTGTDHPVIDSLAAGEARTVTASFEGDRLWRSSGRVHVVAPATDSLTAALHTFTLP